MLITFSDELCNKLIENFNCPICQDRAGLSDIVSNVGNIFYCQACLNPAIVTSKKDPGVNLKLIGEKLNLLCEDYLATALIYFLVLISPRQFACFLAEEALPDDTRPTGLSASENLTEHTPLLTPETTLRETTVFFLPNLNPYQNQTLRTSIDQLPRHYSVPLKKLLSTYNPQEAKSCLRALLCDPITKRLINIPMFVRITHGSSLPEGLAMGNTISFENMSNKAEFSFHQRLADQINLILLNPLLTIDSTPINKTTLANNFAPLIIPKVFSWEIFCPYSHPPKRLAAITTMGLATGAVTWGVQCLPAVASSTIGPVCTVLSAGYGTLGFIIITARDEEEPLPRHVSKITTPQPADIHPYANVYQTLDKIQLERLLNLCLINYTRIITAQPM